MSRHKGFTNRFTPGQAVCWHDDDTRTGTIISSGRDLRAVVGWDAGGQTTELWCDIRARGPVVVAQMPFPKMC